MKNFTRLFLRSVLCAALAFPALSSCVDDDALWDKINELEFRLDSLETNLNKQVEALNALTKDGSTISSCKKNSDGSYLIELSDGTKFTVMPEGTSFSSLVSCTVVDGKNCLATIGPDGNPVVLRDVSGNPVPVGTSVEVKIEEGVYYLVINGTEYMTGYDTEDVVQVFSSCTPLADASGQVYAVKFTLGDGWEVTVTVDGYKGVMFKLSAINNAVLTEYFVDYGQTQAFLLDTKGVVDYVMQIPDGWRVTERVEAVTGDVYLDVTAPSKETVELGAAVASGDLKAVSVVEGGKAAVTRLTLSAEPYKEYNVSSARAVIEMYEGVQKYMYGLSLISEFDQTQIVAKVNELLGTSASLPEGYFMAESAVNKSYEEIYPALDVEKSYVFWVVPAIYYEEGEEAGFYAREDMFRYLSLSPVSVSLTCKDVTLLDATLDVKVMGTSSVYAGTISMRDDQGNLKTAEKALDEIVYGINNGIYEPVSNPEVLNYEGAASSFPDPESPLSFDPATEYLSWIVPMEAGKTQYYATDVVYTEFKTLEIKEGGNLKVTVGESVVDYSSISAPISSEGAAMIYYAYLDKSTGDRYSGETISNITKWAQINAASTVNAVRGSEVDALIDELMPETTMWLYAAAVGYDGLYGEVKCVSASTSGYEFNDLSVEVALVEVGSDEATFQISVTGGTAVDYIYWVGRTSVPFWTQTCGRNISKAEKFMAANPDADAITAVMSANEGIAADGSLTVTGLSIGKGHRIVVLAKDADGRYSKAGSKTFDTAAIDLGDDYVAEGTDKWNETKKWIEDNIVWHKEAFHAAAGGGQGFASYAFDIKTPTDLIAYISCFSPVATELADMIVELETFCTKSRDVSVNVPDPENLIWYDDRGKVHDASRFFSVYDAYVHGVASYGYVTYFPSAGHNETTCPVWDSGLCQHYEAKKQAFADRMSLDYWKGWVVRNCNYDYLGDPNSEYSYHLTDETKINALAQAFVDAYTPHYKDREPILYINDGSALTITNREAFGLDENKNVVDKITILLKDQAGNYYAPMVIQVPNYFE